MTSQTHAIRITSRPNFRELSRATGIKANTLSHRWHRQGIRCWKQLTRPPQKPHRIWQGKTFQGWSDYFALYGVTYAWKSVRGFLYYRLEYGDSEHQALQRMFAKVHKSHPHVPLPHILTHHGL